MTTSVLTQFDLIQYFASLDPYSYSVDNRPLADLKQNIDVLGKAHDASLDAAKLAAVATGMLARGIVGENVMVGKKSIGSMNLIIDHGIFVKEGAVYGSDPNAQFFPKMGLQQQGVVFSLSAAGLLVNQIRYYTISARFQAPNNTLSFYDTTNPNTSNSVEIGTVEYNPIQSIVVTGVFDTSYFPTPPVGYYPLFHVAVPYGTTSLTSDMITNVNFVDDLTRAYDSYSVLTTGPALITDITVNANYALVFADGVFQNSSQYTVLSPESIQWNSTLPAGVNLDFVTIRGGGGGGGGGSGVYAYQDDSYTVPVGPDMDTFTVAPPLDSDFVFVFVNGIFQRDIDRSISGQVTIPSSVPTGTIIDFVQTLGGTSLPLGGISGQSTHKSGAGPTDVWQNEVLSVNVNSASGANPLAYIAAPVGFAESFDLYEGRQILLTNNGGFTSVPTNGATTPTVTLQVGALAPLPVTRPGNVPLRNNDIYSGAEVVYRTTRFELVNPGMPDVVHNYSVITGDENDIEVTPEFPMLRVPNGAIFSIKVPSVLGGNTQELCTLKVNFTTGNLTAPIGKLNGSGPVGLRYGDIQGEKNHLFQFNQNIGYFILLNPANQPVLEVSGAKRQTVLTGPYYSSRSYEKVDTPNLTRQTVTIDSKRPTPLAILSGENLSVQTGVIASFASGFDRKGPVDYIEELPTTLVSNLATVGRGWTSATITDIAVDATSSWITLAYSTNVNPAGPNQVTPGNWVRIRGMVGTTSIPLVGLNGIYYVEAASGNNLQVSCFNTLGGIFLVGDGILNTVIDRVYFAYATRNSNGDISYGLSKYPPLYARSSIEDFSSPVSLTHLYVGQCIFDIDKMKMYEIQTGGFLLEVQRVFIGEVYVPDALTPVTDDFINSYEYNGKYSAYLESYGNATDAFMVHNPSVPPSTSPLNDLRHGLGTYVYDVKITALQSSPTAGRAIGGLLAGERFLQQQSVIHMEPLIARRDFSQLCFALPSPAINTIDSMGRKYLNGGTSLSTNCNYLIELERSF